MHWSRCKKKEHKNLNFKHYSLATTSKGNDNMEKNEKHFAVLLAKAFFLRVAN
jgi:hypothetical protein